MNENFSIFIYCSKLILCVVVMRRYQPFVHIQQQIYILFPEKYIKPERIFGFLCFF